MSKDCPTCGRPCTTIRWDAGEWRAYHADNANSSCEITRAEAHKCLEYTWATK